MLSYDQLTIADFKSADQFLPYIVVMEALADMMDRALQPDHGMPEPGASSEAAKAISRQITAAARAQIEQIKQARDMKEQLGNGVSYDNQ